MAKAAHDASEGRCVLTLPLLTEPYQEHILEKRFRIMEQLQNSLIAFELRKLRRTKQLPEYREIMQKLKDADEKTKKALFKERNAILKENGFSEFAFIDDVTPMQKHFVSQIAAHPAHCMASDVWRAFDKYLYGSGKAVHFKPRGSLESIANKKPGNTMNFDADSSLFTWNGGKGSKINLAIRVRPPENEYEHEMLKKNIKFFRVVRKWMGGKYRYYLQFTLVGKPFDKHRVPVPGRVGIDIGTQSAAVASGNDVFLTELADRVNKNHRYILQLQRKMDASRRATNPGNYNEDGTIRRGIKLKWNKSKRYIQLAAKLKEFQRKNAAVRKQQHILLANRILELGSEIYVEQMSFSGLQHRAKKTEKNEKGKFKRKKRFGKSLADKAPSMFLTILDNKLKGLCGTELHRVDTFQFRASQFNHLNGKYKKKSLATRMFTLEDDPLSPIKEKFRVQRDLYSAFLIMNARRPDAPGQKPTEPDLDLCNQNFDDFYRMHNDALARLRAENRPLLSSFGIA